MRLCTCFFHYIYFNNTVKDFAQAGCTSLLNPGLGRHHRVHKFKAGKTDAGPGGPAPEHTDIWCACAKGMRHKSE
jgi:hypothetical protein